MVHHISSSYHKPIQVYLVNTRIVKKLFRFKFENTLLKDPNFHKEVSEHWSKIPPSHLLPNLLNVSRFMAKWGRVFFNKFREKVKNQKKSLMV